MNSLVVHAVDFVTCSPIFTLTAAPPAPDPPRLLRPLTDWSVKLKLFQATEKYGPVDHYYIIVMPDAIARHSSPDDFKIDEVCFSVYNLVVRLPGYMCIHKFQKNIYDH